MLKHYINTVDGACFFYTDFHDSTYRSLFMNSALFKVVYCKTGNSILNVDGKIVILKSNELLFCEPLQMVDVIYNDGGNISAIAFNEMLFSEEKNKEMYFYFLSLHNSNRQPIKFRFSFDEASEIISIYNYFFDGFNCGDGISNVTLLSILKRLFIKMNKKENVVSSLLPLQKNLIKNTTSYRGLIKKHSKEWHDVQQHFHFLYYNNPESLKQSGIESSFGLFGQKQIFKAKKLLLSTLKTSEQISSELGHSYPNEFANLFKAEVGMSPLDYRNMYLPREIMN